MAATTTSWNDKYSIQYPLRPSYNTEMKVIKVDCILCTVYGREINCEQRLTSATEEAEDSTPKRKRRIISENMFWSPPYRGFKFKSHFETSHARKFLEFQSLLDNPIALSKFLNPYRKITGVMLVNV